LKNSKPGHKTRSKKVQEVLQEMSLMTLSKLTFQGTSPQLSATQEVPLHMYTPNKTSKRVLKRFTSAPAR